MPDACRVARPARPVPWPSVLPRPRARTVVDVVAGPGGQTVVTGFLAASPTSVRDEFLGRRDVEVIAGEDERFEAEITLRDDEILSEWKLTRVCPQGSAVSIAFVAR